MNLDDSRIRTLVLAACPHIEPKRLEVSEVNYGDLMGFWHRKEDGTVHTGNVIAIKRTEAEVAAEIAEKLLVTKSQRDIDEAVITALKGGFKEALASPYEGKRGKHPNNCTCSKHLKTDGRTPAFPGQLKACGSCLVRGVVGGAPFVHEPGCPQSDML